MPDITNQHLPGVDFERNVAALDPPSVKFKGGIISPDNYKSYVVNIRPTRWEDKFWIGKIVNYVEAQFIADAVYYYIGHPPFHLKKANFKFPPLECIGTATPLTDREMCLRFTSSIAKGEEFKCQRRDFKQKVTKLVREKVKSAEVQRDLLQFRDESGSAAIAGEGVAGDDDDDDAGVQARHPTAMEVDDDRQQAIHLRLVQSSSDGPEAVDQNVKGEIAHVAGFDRSGDNNDDESVEAGDPTPMEVDEQSEQATHLSVVLSSRDGLDAVDQSGNAHVPGFDISGPEFNLQSDLIALEFFSMDAFLGSLKNGNMEDHHESVNTDEEAACSVTGGLEKNSFDHPHCSSVFEENFQIHFFAMGDAC